MLLDALIVGQPRQDPGARKLGSKVSAICASSMVGAVQTDERQRREMLEQAVARRRACEALEQFLQDQPGADDGLALFQRTAQCVHFRAIGWRVPLKCQRPHRGVDQQAHAPRFALTGAAPR